MSGGSVLAVVLGGLVILTLLALLVARSVTVRVNPEAAYADLAPAPDSRPWGTGDERSFWLSTNRPGVELRVSSVALGTGSIDRVFPESGRERLGGAVGCLDFAVVSLTATSIAVTSFDAEGLVERPPGTGAATVHIRSRMPGQAWSAPDSLQLPPGDPGFTHSFPTVTEGVWEVEVSGSPEFHEAATRRTTVDTTAGTATTDDAPDGLHLPQDAVVGILACREHDDVVLSLHGEDGAELNRYFVDIGPPRPKPTPTLSPDAGYAVRRVCVDDPDSPAAYLDGGETVGASFLQADFGGRLAGPVSAASLSSVVPGDSNIYFFEHSVSGGAVQLSVSGLGAADQGLDTDQSYPVRLTARDAAGATAFLDVGVWLDSSETSPNGDGLCP